MPDQGQNVQIFLETLRQFLPSLTNQPDDQLTRRIGKEKLQDCAADVAGFIEHGAPGNLTRNERRALTTQVFECLITYIKSTTQPVTLNTLITNIGLVDYAVDNAFPGYSESKLLRYLVVPLKSQEILPVRN